MTSRILKQMGITKWHSRFQMPNAAKSILIEEAQTEPLATPQVASAPQPTIAPQPSQQSNNSPRTSPVSGIPELSELTTNTVENTATPSPISTIKSKTPKFRYQAICINQVFCFVPMTLDIQQDISQIQLNFLQNVVFARFSEKPTITNRYTYQWPLFQHDRAEQGIEVAQSFFKEQLITHQKESGFDKIWIFGNLLEELELDIQALNDASKNSTITTLPTLSQSMQSSAAKQSLWQLIK